ncbi:MAG: HYR domain-containing protein, partial [Ferruginibacter sp.]|nr:HYR domain-containing protein [Ferruginibacter sp.]
GVTGTADAGVCYKVVNLTPPTPADNCGIAAAGVTSSGIPAQNRFPVGTTTVTWSVTDIHNNTTTQTQSVVITDNQHPTLTVTPGVTGTADAGVCYKVLNLTPPTPADNCGITTAGVTVSGVPAQNRFPVGTTTVTWSVTDIHNNTTTQTQSVVITDNQPPTLTVTPGVTGTADAGVCYKAVNLAPPTPADNCGIATAGVTVSGVPAENKFVVGTTTVNWSVTDVNGNTTTQMQSVVITDNQPPTLAATPAVSGTADAGVCYKVVNLAAPAPADNCGIATAGVTSSDIPAQNRFPVGTTIVTWSVRDVAGNLTTQTQSVVITDNQPPTLTVTPGVTGNADAGVCYKVVNLTAPTASDNCGIAAAGVTVTGMPAQNRFPVGTTTVSWSVKDVNGNTTTQMQVVTITDKEAPVIKSVSTMPSSLWPPNRKMKAVSLVINTTDNCAGATSRCKVIAIESNEANDQPNGDTQVDYEILGDQLVNLRAERSASGEGREYKITVQCEDGNGNISTATTIVRVAHIIKTPAAGSSVRIGTTINMTGAFWDVAGNKHTAKWLVDGTSVNGTLTEPAGTKNGTVKGSYKLSTAGVYKLQMNVTDQKNVTSYATTNGYDEAIVVAYDPNGGYTYGGKKYRSPKGAMPSNPTVAGVMTYGFQTNYYKGATNPKGETWFILNNGEFEFNALNFDYLVVSGAKAQFKGLGKMVRNGIEQSGVAFILTVIDGQLSGGGNIDKIRMKIYNKNSGEVYYDNQPGASDADAPVTAVENNSSGDGVVIVNANLPVATVTSQAGTVVPELFLAEEFELQVKAYPNPTEGRFTVVVNTSNRRDEIQLRVVDISGRVIELKNSVVAGQTLQFGHTYAPGTYFIEVAQGKARKQVKVFRLSK